MKPKQIVSLVLEEMRSKRSAAEIARKLEEMGISPDDAPAIVDSVSHGFKAGTVFVVTSGLSARQVQFGENPFFDIAFNRGKAAMRFTTPFWILMRFVGPLVVIVILLIVLIKALR